MIRELDENRIIGELLVNRGIVTKNQISSALFIQQEKPHLRIGEILLSMGLITMEQLDRILRDHLSHQFIGSLLLSNGFISQEQLGDAMAMQEKSGRRLGEILVEMGYLTEYQLHALLHRQQSLRRAPLESLGAGHALKKTKIVATLGPSCSSDEMICKMIGSGVNLFRLNFSHGTHQDHAANIERVRRVASQMRCTVGILQDIQGPKIRIGDVEGGEVILENGAKFELTNSPMVATAKMASVTYARLLEDIPEGAVILVDDGRIELKVVAVTDRSLLTEVKVGGPLRPKKGVNFPGTPLGISVLTDKDKSDLIFGARNGVDWVAVSFVQSAEDILEVRAFLKQHDSRTPLVAKIERREAVYALQEILAVADGVMVARGDLGVETPAEDVPIVQKEIIHQANFAGKPVITATQMLDSMIHAPRPTRAEASDVANAILDGTDAVMLSNETAAGDFPIEAVETMARIIEKTEGMNQQKSVHSQSEAHHQLGEAVAIAATQLASEVGAAAILVPSYSGATARLVSRFRPSCLIVATSSSAEVCRQMELFWGVYPLHLGEGVCMLEEELDPKTVEMAKENLLVKSGDLVVIMEAASGAAGRTRSIRVEKVI